MVKGKLAVLRLEPWVDFQGPFGVTESSQALHTMILVEQVLPSPHGMNIGDQGTAMLLSWLTQAVLAGEAATCLLWGQMASFGKASGIW